MKEQTLYLLVNTTLGYVLNVFDTYPEAACWCDDLNEYIGDNEYKVIRIYDEDIMKVGVLNAN